MIVLQEKKVSGFKLGGKARASLGATPSLSTKGPKIVVFFFWKEIMYVWSASERGRDEVKKLVL